MNILKLYCFNVSYVRLVTTKSFEHFKSKIASKSTKLYAPLLDKYLFKSKKSRFPSRLV